MTEKFSIKKSKMLQHNNGIRYKEILTNISTCFNNPMHTLCQVRESIYRANRYNLKQNGYQFDKRKILKLKTTTKFIIRVI